MHKSAFLLLATFAPLAPAQSICDGNGIGSAYVRSTFAPIGGTMVVDFGSPAAPSGFGLVAISDGFGPVLGPPPINLVCIDFLSPLYTALFFAFDASGAARWQLAIPNIPALFGFPPLYVHAGAFEGSPSNFVLSISRTLRVDVELPDTWRRVVGLQVGRSLHTATSLQRSPNDHRIEVLLAGGDGGNFMQPVATATTDLFDPMQRSFRGGPAMTQPRCGHTATLLLDGRVLVTGGADTGGVVTPMCEVYDPATNAFAPVAPMSTPRTAHRATLLPDGQVLVTGGLPDWTLATTQFVPRLNAALDSAEVYDPVANAWSALPAMASKRAGHVQIALADGRVLVASGINGGTLQNMAPFGVVQVPNYTPTCEIFDPATNAFAAAAATTNPGAFAAASLMPNGDVLVTGGIAALGSYGAAMATSATTLFDGTAWVGGAVLPATAMMHQQVVLRLNEVFVSGGVVGDLTTLSGSAVAAAGNHLRWDPRSDIGVHGVLGTFASPRGAQTATLLPDGSVLVAGGSHQLTPYDDAWVYYR